MFHLTHTMTITQFLEYERLKKLKPPMTEADLYTAITGSFLCLGKTLFSQIGFVNLAQVFLNCSSTFFWILILINIYKGIENAHNPKTRIAGISQLVGSGIGTILKLR